MAIYVHVGQCGIQTGDGLWEQVSRAHYTPTFTVPDGTFPALLIDTDHKTITSCKASHKSTHNMPGMMSVVGSGKGCGGNWSNGLSEGKQLQGQVLDELRRLAEKFDCFMGFIMIHSMAGGTGSGLTSHLLESLTDEYPLQYKLNFAISPFGSGETPLQHYNALLCLPFLQLHSNAVILFDNDLLYKTTSTNGHVTMAAMNDYIVQTMVDCVRPLNSNKKVFTEPWDMIGSVAPLPQYKFAAPSHVRVTRPTATWNDLIREVLQTRDKHKTLLSLIAILRGNQANTDKAMLIGHSVIRQFKHHYRPVSWNPYPIDLWFGSEADLKDGKRLTTITNSDAVVNYIKMVADRSNLMYQAKAYLHWFNDDCVDFKSSFELVSSIIDSYNSLK